MISRAIKRFVLGFSCLAVASLASAQGSTAEARVDAMLEAMGGRNAWAAAQGYRVDADHWLAGEPQPFANAILLDFKAPRLRIESKQANNWRTRIVSKDRGKRITRSEVRELTKDEVADEEKFWASNVYRTVHRLARRDPALSVEMRNERLYVLDGGKPLVWFMQNQSGEPIAFAPADAAGPTIFGPLQAWDGLKFPRFSVRDDGRWRAIIRSFKVNPDLSDARMNMPRSTLP